MKTNVQHAAYRLLSLTFLSAAFLLQGGCGGGPVPAPTAYKPFEYKDGSWACDYPEGWTAEAGGKKNSWGKFTSGGAQVKLQTDITGSLMADMASIGQKDGPATPEDYPVHKVHVGAQEEAAAEFGDYKEQEPVEFLNAVGGSSRKSEFTASGGFSGPIHGYRATFINRDRRFRVTCTCSESDWQTLKPAFDKVLESFRSAG